MGVFFTLPSAKLMVAVQQFFLKSIEGNTRVVALEELKSLANSEATLNLHGKPIDVDSLAFLPNHTTLSLAVSLLGGKVHGTLSKSGKVRAATPKVAKQPKGKKVPCSRARMRVRHAKIEAAKQTRGFRR